MHTITFQPSHAHVTATHWQRLAIGLFCGALLASCASKPEPLSVEKRQQLGMVYLSSAGPTGEIFFHADFANGGTSGALKGAGKGAVQAMDGCVNSALSSGPLAPLVLLVCTSLQVPANIAAGSAAGSEQVISEETLASVEQQANQVLQHADLSSALVATLDDLSQKREALAQYEISHGTLPVSENGETVNNVAAKWGYQTVMEVHITKAGFETDEDRVPMMHLSMTANIRLVEAKSGSVLQQQEYQYNGEPQSVSEWFSNNFRKLYRELALANQVLASDILHNTFIDESASAVADERL